MRAWGKEGEGWVTDVYNAVMRDGEILNDLKMSWMVAVIQREGRCP